jgi:hypothetical protein
MSCTCTPFYTFSLAVSPMQSHSNTPADPVADILLQKIPPVYGNCRAAFSLSTIIVSADVGSLVVTYTLAHAARHIAV